LLILGSLKGDNPLTDASKEAELFDYSFTLKPFYYSLINDVS